VDLDKFISGIFTKTEIRCRKDDPEFFRSISKILNTPPDHMIMIGDDFEQDVMSAHRAGLHTFWLNSKGVELDPGIPYQDAEILNLGEIIRVLESKLPPTIETCDTWLEEYHVPANIRRHMQAVADDAYKLAVKLHHANVDLDPIMVHRAGWLHDIGKLQENTVKRDHGEVGADILREKGEAELAEIIEKHVVESILREPFHEWSWNTKIVFYVDKLFDGEIRMDAADRLALLVRRYPKSKKEITKALPLILEFEDEIKL
jgi:putative nucleotidyltransferase with HDIG domain